MPCRCWQELFSGGPLLVPEHRSLQEQQLVVSAAQYRAAATHLFSVK